MFEIGFLIVFATVSVILCVKWDQREWNGGSCPCGGSWAAFDMDEHGSVYYRCSGGCGEFIEQSWGLIWRDWQSWRRGL